MKKCMFFIAFLCLFQFVGFSEDSDSTKINKLKKEVSELTTKVDTLQTQLNKQIALQSKSSLNSYQKFYILMPVLLFLLIFMVVVIWLSKTGFKIGDALSGDTPLQTTTIDSTGQQITTTCLDNDGKPIMPKSSSRIIAFFSGFSAIIISLSLISYYAYFAMRNQTPPDFNNLFEIIVGLGIGVVPYAVNKFNERK